MARMREENTEIFPILEIFIAKDMGDSASVRTSTLSTSERVLEPGVRMN